jgi:sodium-dependent dicarboxylate transporter 2/3/5
MRTTQSIGLIAGPALFFLLTVAQPDSIPDAGWDVIRVAVWMLVWWVTEAVHLAVPSLLPILLFPLLGVMDVTEACRPYGSKFVFLFFGGFVIALAMEKWHVHRRIALGIVRLTGNGANRIILGFMLASGLLSMWISNTATTVMMLPIAVSVIALLTSEGGGKGHRNFSIAIMLGIAYAANVGGVATLVGTPPNAAMAGILFENYNIEIGFMQWMKIGVPVSIVMLFLVYFFLVRLVYPNKLGKFTKGTELINSELKKMGRWTEPQIGVIGVFILTAMLWIFRQPINKALPFIDITDTGIAIFAAVLLFVLPSHFKGGEFILKWKDTEKLPWGILLLFGGGLSLAGGFKATGLIELIAGGFSDFPSGQLLLFILLLAFVALYLTELMSNLALVNIFVPIVAAVGFGAGESPLLFAVPVTIASSCAFMFPMSTPPNAIVFASGHIRISQMARAGVWLNLVAVVVVTLLCYLFLDKWILGV